MSVQNDILEVLNQRGQPVKTSELAEALKKPSSTIRGETTRLKQRGYIEGDSQEGWVITDTAKEQLEKGGIHPSMIDEGVTPRQQFEAIGHRIGIKDDRVVLASDIVWSGDFNDVKWVWQALGQANIADDLRGVWVNAWRAKLHKSIPPELETELTGVGKAEAESGEGTASRKPGGREYIIVDDEPVRVGANLGDYSLQDAKDIMGIRALRSRFSGAGQAGTASQPGTTERVSDLLTALSPYLNKGGTDETLKELISTQMELQKQEILSRIPQPGQPAQPKTFMEQITLFIAALGSLKEAGPMLRSILGVPESSGGNPSAGVPVQLAGPDGKPMVMDIGQVINWQKFQGDERRADERQTAITETMKTARENIPDGIQAILQTVAEVKGGAGAKPSTPVPQAQPQIKCSCDAVINLPAGDWLEFQCPQCQQVWTREQVKEALGQ